MKEIKKVEARVDELPSPTQKRRKTMKRKTMKIGMAVMCILVTVTLVSAGILSLFGQMDVTADVKQSVVWDGDGNWHGWDDPIEYNIDVFGGCQYCNKTKIWNRCECGCPGGWLDLDTEIWGPGGPDGVEVHYWHLPGDLTLVLDNKDPNTWEPIDDEYLIELIYNPCCPEFDWCLNGRVPLADTEYVLIYYADQPDRFVNWGGAPALELGIVNSDASGYIDECGSKELDASFPIEEDWNIGPEADYHISDGYNHAKGAKIWLIPTSDYNGCGQVLTGWNPSNYMFETDLVVYFDCDLLPIPWIAKAYFENAWNVNHEFPYYIEAGEKICLVYCFCFDWAILPGTYTIQTKLIPSAP